MSIRRIRDSTDAVHVVYTRKRFDALGREVCSRRRAPCQEADIAMNENPTRYTPVTPIFILG